MEEDNPILNCHVKSYGAVGDGVTMDTAITGRGAIRNLYFSNIHSFAVHAPTIIGRKDCPVENIYFNNCHFIQKERNEFDPNEPGLKNDREHTCTPCFRHVKNPVKQNTVISTP